MVIITFNVVSSFGVAVIVANLTEWLSHKYILHGLGKKKDSWFHFHWKHHYIARKNNFIDLDYKVGFFKSSSYRKEIYSLLGLLLINIWWLWIWPMLFFWLVFFTVFYFYVHSKCHLNPEWCRKYFKHHWDHHMGTNQDLNWGVTTPLWDYIFGTRLKYKYDKNDKVIK